MDIITVTKAQYITGKKLALTFNDGVEAEVDFSMWIERYPFFEQLKDADYFRNFTLDGWTVSWPNGADIAPETLHQIAVKTLQTQTA